MSTSQIEKQQFKNQSGGHLGVVIIGPRGDDKGIAVEPDGTVWLSEAEQRLTANAPRRPEDNPFLPQKHQRLNVETNEMEEYEVTPLVPVSENRYVPADLRFIPGNASEGRALGEAQVAATGATPVQPVSADLGALQREAEVREAGDDVKPGVVPTPRARAAALNATERPVESNPEPPSAPSAPEEQPVTPPEETAAQVNPAVGEETGAAVTPAADAPQGEYQAGEEVGTPQAPASTGFPTAEPGGDTETEGRGEQTQPWTPGS